MAFLQTCKIVKPYMSFLESQLPKVREQRNWRVQPVQQEGAVREVSYRRRGIRAEVGSHRGR